jgi:peptidoglycan/xylan/chitin deacetylase (PgdA/CDA1 family)
VSMPRTNLLRVSCVFAVVCALAGLATAAPSPNEAGVIPIIMYHSVGERAAHGPMRYDRMGLNIRSDTFRKQLRLMRDAGWYPVNTRDAASARINVPAGKTPVVLTFDDARGSQFRYLRDGRIDPDCAVGILQTFSKTHPDWPLRATFYVLPGSRYNPVAFWQRGREKAKLEWLVRAGFEVANHSVSHGWMSRMGAERIRWEVAEAIRLIRRLAPGATMDTFAVPYGAMPRSRALLKLVAQGEQGGTTYRNAVVLMAWGGPTHPPAHRLYDALRVSRIGSAPGEVEATIRRLAHGDPPRYVSDGNPATVTVPKSAVKLIAPARLAGARLVVLPSPPRPAPAKRK